jgi:hypothetical protein
MSIVVLKNKTYAKYKNMSVGQPQFSLNGGYRNQGWVGQTSLSRHYPKTPMKGSGGCCGTYNNVPVVLSAVTSTENNCVIKGSVKGTEGQLATQYRWIRRPQPYATVKPDTTRNNNDSSSYTDRLRKTTISQANACESTVTGTNNCKAIQTNICNNRNSNLGVNKNFYKIAKPIVNSFAKGKSGKMAGFIGGGIPKVQSKVQDTQTQYLLQLDISCTNDEIQYNKINRAPYAGFATTY